MTDSAPSSERDVALRPLHVLALCAGVGGLELGIQLARPDARCVAYVEREAYAAATLVARVEDGSLHPAPVWSDLATFDARPWRGRVHCVASGDPCQPNSKVGRQGGVGDDRFLIDQVLRVVAECRPGRFFRENVPGNADGQLGSLVPALEAMGYVVAAGIFSAADVGARHGRERLFLMADAAVPGLEGRDGRGGQAGQGPEGHARPGAWWHSEPAVGRVADGPAGRMDRLQVLGNGVVPLVAAHAWRSLESRLRTPV